MKNVRIYIIIVFLSLVSGCKTIQKMFNVINVDLGVESSMLRFVSKKSNPVYGSFQAIAGSKDDVGDMFNPVEENPDVYKVTHSDYNPKVQAYMVASLPPTPISYLENRYGIFRYLFNISAGIRSPHTFRGTLKNYPDLDLKNPPIDPVQLYLLEHADIPDYASRRLEYRYEEMQFYLSLYPVYIVKNNWMFGIGYNYGNRYYDLEIYEKILQPEMVDPKDSINLLAFPELRVSKVTGHFMPVLTSTVILGYRFGAHMEKENPFSGSFIYIEYTGIDERGKGVKTGLRRSYGGANPNPLLIESHYFSIGIRKSIQLGRN